MKFILLSFFLLQKDSCLFAQNGQNDFEPIDTLIRRLQPTGTVYYADNADRKIYSKLAILANGPLFKSQWDTTKENTLKLTPAERKSIQSQLSFSAKIKLPDSLFENSKRIRKDSLVPFVDNLNRRILDSLGHLPDSIRAIAYRNYRPYTYWSFIFTKPVYLRNRTIAVFYFMYYTNSSGVEGSDFYKKNKDNQWHRWIMVSGMGGAW